MGHRRKRRYLDVGKRGGGFERIRLKPDAAQALVAADILYPCGDGAYRHDLHLNPELTWSVEIVERLLAAIDRSSIPAKLARTSGGTWDLEQLEQLLRSINAGTNEAARAGAE